MKKIKLYIDDIRQPPKGWSVVRTVREAIKFIEMYGNDITHISLDHDISYKVKINGKSRPYPSPECFCSVARYLRETEYRPKVILHTANPNGAGTMKFILKDFNPEYTPCEAVNGLEKTDEK